MARKLDAEPQANKEYKLLATSRTSTMQKELQQAGDQGFDFCGQTYSSRRSAEKRSASFWSEVRIRKEAN